MSPGYLQLEFGKGHAPKPAAKRLIVLVKGLGSSVFLADVVDLARSEAADADVVTASYNSRPFSNADCAHLARDLALEIDRLVSEAKTRGGYRSIVLGGHSLGAVLVQAAYLMAAGCTFSSVTLKTSGWARPQRAGTPDDDGPFVERLVFLAGVLKGWNVPDVDKLGRFKRTKWGVISSVLTYTSLTNGARYMRSAISGSPFIVDTRMNWLRMVKEEPQKEPHVVQLYGTHVSLIGDDDVRDFVVGAKFKHRRVVGTSHFDMAVLTDNRLKEARQMYGVVAWASLNPLRLFGVLLIRWLLPIAQISNDENRRTEVRRALLGDWEEIESNEEAVGGGGTDPATVEHVVFIRHGIRDHSGGWVKRLGTTIRQTHPAAVVQDHSYGRFSMLQFLLPGARIRRVHSFMHEYLNFKARHWTAKFHFFGHSYGTYIGSNAVRRYRTCTFENMALGNSVMGADFPWTNPSLPATAILGKDVTRIANLGGSADWIVAGFPGLFQWLRESWFRFTKDPEAIEYLGQAGFGGFYTNAITNVVAEGGHDASILGGLDGAIAKFLITGDAEFPASVNRKRRVSLVAKFPPLAWGTMIGIAAGIGYLLALAISWLTGVTMGWPLVVAATVIAVPALLHWV